MKHISRICGHGPQTRYKRSNVPAHLCDELGISVGTVISWEILDNDSAVVKIISRSVA